MSRFDKYLLPMGFVLLCVFLLYVSSAAAKPLDEFVLHGLSKHDSGSNDGSACMSYHNRTTYNERNWGFGIGGSLGQYRSDLELRWEAGQFKNSCDIHSRYVFVAAEVFPTWYGLIGVADNYPEHSDDFPGDMDMTERFFAGAMWKPLQEKRIAPRFQGFVNPGRKSGANAVIVLSLVFSF